MAQQPEPWPSFIRRFKALEQLVQRLLNASPFTGTGLSVPQAGVVQVDGELIVESGEARSGNYVKGASGWRLRPDGTIEMNDAEIRGGIVGNDALTSPVIPGSVWQTASNFALNTSWSTVITATVTVPAGVTSAAVSAKGSVTGFMNQDSPDGVDYLYGMLFVASDSSGTYPLAVSDLGGSGTVHLFRDTVLTGLTPGGSFVIALQASTGYETWTSPSSPGNSARLGASIQWYR